MDHHVRKHTLNVSVDSETLAFSLQPRLQDLNRTVFLPIIERVFDELSRVDHRIILDRLEIDLGTVTKSDLDYIGPVFERKLREALRSALDGLGDADAPDERAWGGGEDRAGEDPRPGDGRTAGKPRVELEASSELEVLDRYLRTGMLPFWVPGRSFDLEDWIARLSSTAPDGLADLFRRRRFDARVTERLAQQLGEASMRRLLGPLVPPGAESIRDLYQSDRPAFLAWLRGGGERLPLDRFLQQLDSTQLEDLVRQLDPQEAGRILADLTELERTQGRDRADQSARSIILGFAADRPSIGESAREERAARVQHRPPSPPASAEARRHEELQDQADEPALDAEHLQQLFRSDRAAFVALIRRRGPQLELAATLLRLDQAALADLVVDLAPGSAAQIARDVAELAGLPYFNRQTDAAHALRHLWIAAADVQVRALDQPYERRAFVEALLTAFAESVGQVPADVFTAIVRDWPSRSDEEIRAAESSAVEPRATEPRAAEQPVPEPIGVEPAVVEPPLREPALAPPSVPDVRGRDVAGRAPVSLRSLVTEMAADRPPLSSRAGEEPESGAPPGPMFSRYDSVDAVQYYMRYGVLPFSVSLLRPALAADDVLEVLPELPLGSLREALADVHEDGRIRAWRRVLRDLGDDRVERLIAALIQQSGLPVAPTWSRLMTQVMDAADDTAVYAAFIVQLLETGSIDSAGAGPGVDLAQEVRGGVEQNVGVEPDIDIERDVGTDVGAAAWETHYIKAVLSSRARGAGQVRAGEPTSFRLLLTLIERDVEAARDFVRAIQDAALAPSALVDEMPSEGAVMTIQRLLEPDAAVALTQLRESLAALPPDQRPAAQTVRAVIVREILEQRDNVPQPLQALLDAVLRALPLTSSTLASLAEVNVIDVPGIDTQPIAGQPAGAAPPATAAASPVWLRRLAGGADPAGASLPDDARRHALLRAIDQTPDIVHDAVVKRLGDRGIRERWAEELSEPELVRMAYVLEPRRHRVLMDAAELLFAASLRVEPDRGSWRARRAAFWAFVLGFLADTQASTRSLDRLIADFVNVFGGGRHAPDARPSGTKSEATPAGTVPAPGPAGTEPDARLPETLKPGADRPQPVARSGATDAIGPAAIARLLDSAAERAVSLGNAAVRAVLQRDRAALLGLRGATAPPSSSPPDQSPPQLLRRPVADDDTRVTPERSRPAFSMDEDATDAVSDAAEPIYLANAGLVLANPFLPQWFRALDLLDESDPAKVRLRPHAISRAVHLLQWLVNGSVETPEPLLGLNKLLSGAPLVTPVARRIEPTDRELEVCERMLRSMIGNWPIIRSTSIAGLRETFLQREGRLESTPAGWRLVVQRKTVDVLVDQIPWSISTIFHAWMPEPISVVW